MHIRIEVTGPFGCGKTHLLNILRSALDAHYTVTLIANLNLHYTNTPPAELFIAEVNIAAPKPNHTRTCSICGTPFTPESLVRATITDKGYTSPMLICDHCKAETEL